MNIIEKYANLRERAEKVALHESHGLRMLHDDFDSTWKPGDEPHGTMTFTDELQAVIPTEPVRNLALEIDDLKVRIEKLEMR